MVNLEWRTFFSGLKDLDFDYEDSDPDEIDDTQTDDDIFKEKENDVTMPEFRWNVTNVVSGKMYPIRKELQLGDSIVVTGRYNIGTETFYVRITNSWKTGIILGVAVQPVSTRIG